MTTLFLLFSLLTMMVPAHAGTVTLSPYELDHQRDNAANREQAVKMYDGKVFMTGRTFPNLADLTEDTAAIFDRLTGQWTTAPDPPFFPQALIKVRGKPFLFSGADDGSGIQAAFWKQASGTYETLPSPPTTDRYGAYTVTVSPGHDKIFVIGGGGQQATLDTVDIFDLDTKTWAPTSTLPRGAYGHQTVGVHHPTEAGRYRIVVIGGYERATAADPQDYHTYPVYWDSSTEVWEWATTSFINNEGHRAMRWNKGSHEMLIVGGYRGGLWAYTPGIYMYDIWSETKTWEGDLVVPRFDFSMIKLGTANDDVLIVGGYQGPLPGTTDVTGTLERFTTGVGSSLEPETIPVDHEVYQPVMFYLSEYPNGRTFIAGGKAWGHPSEVKHVYRWDP